MSTYVRPTTAQIQADDLERSIYLDDRRTALKHQAKLESKLGQLFDELWDQCSPELKAKLKGEDGFTHVDTARDPLQLHNCIKRVCCGFEAHKMKYYALTQAIKSLFLSTNAQGCPMKSTCANSMRYGTPSHSLVGLSPITLK